MWNFYSQANSSQPVGDLLALERRQANILARLNQLQQQVEALVVRHGSAAASKSSVQVHIKIFFEVLLQVMDQVVVSCSWRKANHTDAFRVL